MTIEKSGLRLSSSSLSSVGRANEPPSSNSIQVFISPRLLIFTLFGCATVTFALGCLCRNIIVNELRAGSSISYQKPEGPNLPHVYYWPNKPIPKTIYTSKTFMNDNIHAGSDTLLAERSLGTHVQFDENIGSVKLQTETAEIGEEIHEPAGQHLMIDIENVDVNFLNSEERIAQAMVDIVTVSGLTMLSYHCHSFEPMGISCIGVLLESHIAAHTWPLDGIIILDLFTCGSKPLIPLLPLIEKLFGIPRQGNVGEEMYPKPNMNWAHKKRGFHFAHEISEDEEEAELEYNDMDRFTLGWVEYDLKTLVHSIQTEFQTVDIYDVINPRFNRLKNYKKSLVSDESYESRHPEMFKPDRILYLNGVIQSRRFGEAAFHESLVHPAMLTHPHPKRVAIIGGGEGATLREVLKHNTVQEVTVIEIDEMVVNVSRTYLSDWSDCSNLEGSTESCFDDPRANFIFTNAYDWFIKRFLVPDDVTNVKYDVVIMDSIASSIDQNLPDLLFTDRFAASLFNSLAEDGVFVASVGEDNDQDDFPEVDAATKFLQNLEGCGFKSIKEYDESHGGLLDPWKFVIAMKSSVSRAFWYANQAQVDAELHRRACQTYEREKDEFRFFDGATMMSYQYPSRICENIFCLSESKPAECVDGHGFDPYRANMNIGGFEVNPGMLSTSSQTFVPEKKPPAGSSIPVEEGTQGILFKPRSMEIIKGLTKLHTADQWKILYFYTLEYGFPNVFYGDTSFSVYPALLPSIHHCCNRTNNIEMAISIPNVIADPESITKDCRGPLFQNVVYNPFIDRNHLSISAYDLSSRKCKIKE